MYCVKCFFSDSGFVSVSASSEFIMMIQLERSRDGNNTTIRKKHIIQYIFRKDFDVETV